MKILKHHGGIDVFDILRFHDRKFLRENRTEKITKSPIQAFRREWIPLLGPDNFKFNDTPIELETSHTIIGSLVQHPVSFLVTRLCDYFRYGI